MLAGAILFAAWYVFSPRVAISQLGDRNAAPEDLLALYDRENVRSAFEQQMVPGVDRYAPPITKRVLLDAMSDPRAVRAFISEPYGDWQFAAFDGLPDELRIEEPEGSMPRVMEITESWEFTRTNFDEIIASPADREDQEGNTYRFERDGLNWRLVAIILPRPIG